MEEEIIQALRDRIVEEDRYTGCSLAGVIVELHAEVDTWLKGQKLDPETFDWVQVNTLIIQALCDEEVALA